MIYQTYWVSLPPDVRTKLKEVFGIKGSTHIEVVNNVVVCDGCKDSDLAGITVDTMREYLGAIDGDFDTLWDKTLDKVQGKEAVLGIFPDPMTPEEEKLMEEVEKPDYTPKKAKEILKKVKKAKK